MLPEMSVFEQEYKKLQIECPKEFLIGRNILPPDIVEVCPKIVHAWDIKLGLRNVVLKKTTEAMMSEVLSVFAQ